MTLKKTVLQAFFLHRLSNLRKQNIQAQAEKEQIFSDVPSIEVYS